MEIVERNLRQFMKSLFSLTLYHTIPTINDPKEAGIRKTLLKKGENTSHQHFVLYPVFSTLSKKKKKKKPRGP